MQPQQRLRRVVKKLHKSYMRKGGFNRDREHNAPSRQRVLEILELLRALLFPGYFGTTPVTATNLEYLTGQRLARVHEMLSEEVFKSLCYVCQDDGRCRSQTAYTKQTKSIV